MKSPVAQEQVSTANLDKFKKRVVCLQRKIKKMEDPELYLQELIEEKKQKYLDNALARFERSLAQPKAEKKAKVDAVRTETEEKKEEVTQAEQLQQMTTEEEAPKLKLTTISHASKAISKPSVAPPSLLRRPAGPQAPVPSLLHGSRLLKQ